MKFDYQSFKAEFRKSAARRGIDPNEGATKAQAHYTRMELLVREREATGRLGNVRWDYDVDEAVKPDWWRNRALWLDPGECESSTEYEALAFVLGSCFQIVNQTPVVWLPATLHSSLKTEPLDIDIMPILRDVERLLRVWTMTGIAISNGEYEFTRGKVYNPGAERRRRGQKRSRDARQLVPA